jgi:probable non-F420 flavinoid oxidoreductase
MGEQRTLIGFHASHEEVPPAELLDAVRRAEESGFAAATCSDHFAPWSRAQGESGYAWSWLGAALQATTLRFGVVTAPGQRYHPAITAQAMATLDSLAPGRFWAALGSGEALNEHITGDGWPEKSVRNARLRSCAEVIDLLFRGEEVSRDDGLVRVDRARLWTLPATPPPLYAAALTTATAAEVASWAQGLILVAQDPPRLVELVEAYRSAGGRGPLILQVHLSWAPTDDEALERAVRQWRTNVLPPSSLSDLETVEQFEQAARDTGADAVREAVLVSSEPGRHAERLHEFVELGFDEIYLHQLGREQTAFIEVFGAEVLPQFA